jgi:hypothetical protein
MKSPFYFQPSPQCRLSTESYIIEYDTDYIIPLMFRLASGHGIGAGISTWTPLQWSQLRVSRLPISCESMLRYRLQRALDPKRLLLLSNPEKKGRVASPPGRSSALQPPRRRRTMDRLILSQNSVEHVSGWEHAYDRLNLSEVSLESSDLSTCTQNDVTGIPIFSLTRRSHLLSRAQFPPLPIKLIWRATIPTRAGIVSTSDVLSPSRHARAEGKIQSAPSELVNARGR